MVKSLNDTKWLDFCLDDLFNISSTSSGIDKCRLINTEGDIPYLTRTDKSNGYELFICEQDCKYKIDIGNVITIGLDTQTVFYQPISFYTGQNIQILQSKHINKYTAIFIIPMIKILMQKFNWGGNGATLTRLRRSRILLPVNKLDEPDYEFMEEYIKEREAKLKEQYKNHVKTRVEQLVNRIDYMPKWKDFFIEEIATINSGRDIYDQERILGKIPYITSSAKNNGISYLVSNINETIEENCLSVNRNGSVGYCFYHPYKALYSNDCRKLRLKYSSKYIGLFVSNVITAQKSKYGYGYKMGTGRLKRQKIMLPITSKGEPDYTYMENYMQYLEQKKLLEYLNYIK